MKHFLRPVLLLWMALLLACVWVVSRTNFTADMSAFLPRKPSPEQQLLVGQLRDGIASRFIVAGIEQASPASLAELSRATAKALRADDARFAAVHNGEASEQGQDQSLIFKYRYLLSPAVKPERFTTEGLHQALSDSIADIASSAGLFTKDLLASDPTGEVMQLVNQLLPTSTPNTTDGVWMSRDNSRASLLLQTRASGSDLDAQEEAHAHLRAAFSQAQQLSKAADAAQAQLVFSGPGVFAVHSRETIKSEASRLSTLGTILVMALLFIVYRSLRTLFLGIVPVLTGALAGIAAVSLAFGSVHGLTLGFGVTLIGEAVDYAIYLFMQYSQPRDEAAHDNVATSADTPRFQKNFWPTIRLGVLTSVCGFSALLFSGFSGLAQLGLFSIAGVVAAALVARFVLPELLAHDFQIRSTEKFAVALGPIVQFLPRLRWLVLALTVLAAGTVAFKHTQLWSHELGALSPVSSADQALDERLRADLSAPDARYLILIKSPTSEAALQTSELVSAQLDALVQAKVISGYDAPSRYLPSQKTQHERMASLPEKDVLKQRLLDAVKGLPLQAQKLDSFVNDIAQSRQYPPLDVAALQGSSLAVAINALLVQDGTGQEAWTALIPLRNQSPVEATKELDAQRVKVAIAQIPHAVLLDIKGEANRMYDDYLREAILLSLAGLAAILVLLSLALRSVTRVWRVCAPLLAADLIVIATFAALNLKLNLLHLVGMLLVIAVGSNYSLFFDQRRHDAEMNGAADNGQMDQSTLASLLIANLTTMIGFGLLSFSHVPVLKAIGNTVGPGALLALLISAILINRSP